MGTLATVVITKTGYFFLFHNLFFSLVEIASILCCFKGGIMADTILKNLVIYIVALAIAGTLVSTGYYFAVQLPGKTTTQVPKNSAEWGGYRSGLHPAMRTCRSILHPGMSYGRWTDDSGSAQFSFEPNRNYKVTVSIDRFRTCSKMVYVDGTS
jgi:hypothetical protein